MSKIVIADHDREFRELAVFALRFAGHEAIGASDGEECSKVTKQTRPDLILIDALLLMVNGYDICRALYLDEDTALIPVVLIQDSGHELDGQTNTTNCGKDIIFKPIDPDRLIDKVNSLLEKKNTAKTK